MIFTDLLDALKRPHPSIPFLQKATNINDAVWHLERLLNSHSKPHVASTQTPTSPLPPPPPVPTPTTD